MDTLYQLYKNKLIIYVGDELDEYNAGIIRKEADAYITKYNINCIIFDFSKTVFMDSSGIGMVIGRYRMIKGLGGNIAICSINDNLNRIFKMSGIYSIATGYENVKEAVKYAGGEM
jgi:stage II sporulation protein AA (anti-sigma F factor antagonist)